MEWLREAQWLGWVAGALVLGLIEVASLDLVFLMLSVAALLAAGAAYLDVTFPVQVVVFVVAAGVLLLVARPLALRKLKPAGPAQLTGVAAYRGRTAEVVVQVTGRSGLVKLSGEQWSARSADPALTFEVGEVVRVVQIDGATAVVDRHTVPPSGSGTDPGTDPGHPRPGSAPSKDLNPHPDPRRDSDG